MTGRLARPPAAADSPRRPGEHNPSGICTMPTITCLNCKGTREVSEYSPTRPPRCANCGGYYLMLDGLSETLPDQLTAFVQHGPLSFPIQHFEGTAEAGQGLRMRLSGSVPRERLPDVLAL